MPLNATKESPVTQEASLTVNNQEYKLPTTIGSENEIGIDITKLRAASNCITLDPGYGNTGSCKSAITFIDGEKGILRYRGYPIEQLAKQSNFTEVAQLLIWGDLPNKGQNDRFNELLKDNALIHENLKHHFQGFPSSAHPMAILSSMINALSCYYGDHFSPDINGDTSKSLKLVSALLISKIRTIAAFSYKMGRGEPFRYPDPRRDYSSNFLHMMFSMPHDRYEASPTISRALDMIFTLHADHEQNCSTSTVRMVGSSGANLFASISAGVCSLWGPLHGGANMAVIKMLEDIHTGGKDIDEYVKLAKDKNSDIKLMGFGHRVYKNFDPRATLLREACDEVFKELNISDPLLDIARKLEDVARNDSYFVDRNLYPNVDFYSGIILKALGVPVNLFTVLFAIGRLPGWIAHWRESYLEGGRISRPRQIYTGETQRDYVPMAKR